jgi:Zn-dependent protease with chaperone function
MRPVIFAVLLSILGLVAVPLFAQPATTPTTPAATASAPSQPVPVPVPSDKAMLYYRSGNVLWVTETLWGFAVPALLLFTGFSARMRDAARKIGRNWFFTIVVYGILFTVVSFLLSLPLDWYSGFARQHAYGLSDQTAVKWWSDSLTGLALGCLVTALTLWVPYLLLRASPKRWWLYTGLAAIPLIVVLLIVTPIWIEPLFNKFGPMKDKALESQILALASRAGIEGGRVYEVNKSVDTKTLDAYVAGIFGTKRIVLWDTIIKRMSQPELMFVMGHEMGHYVLGHTWYLVTFSTLLTMASFYGAYRTAGAVLGRWGARFGSTALADVASLPLLLILLSVFSLLIEPASNAFTRHIEHEADRFGLEITQTSHSAGTAFVKLQEDALANPRPGLLFKLWRESHPPLAERIDFVNDYHPWRAGQPLVYGDRFKK